MASLRALRYRNRKEPQPAAFVAVLRPGAVQSNRRDRIEGLAARRGLATLSVTTMPRDRLGGPAQNPADGSDLSGPFDGALPVQITRREFTIGTGALALTGAGVLVGFSFADLQHPAQAQNPPLAELMQPGPLGDMVKGSENSPRPSFEYASM